MPRKARALSISLSVLLLSSCLVSCSSSANYPVSGESLAPLPSVDPLSSAATPTSSGAVKLPSDQPHSTSTSAPTPTPLPANPSPSLPEEKKEMPVPTPVVEASTLQPDPTEDTSSESSFSADSPSLGGIALDDLDKDVYAEYGQPLESYPLPGDTQSIEIWQYKGFSVGLNADSHVVYVEISSSQVESRIQDLQIGMKSEHAAQLLGVDASEQSNVITAEVAGGWLKLDIDPDTQQVLSLKLLSSEI